MRPSGGGREGAPWPGSFVTPAPFDPLTGQAYLPCSRSPPRMASGGPAARGWGDVGAGAAISRDGDGFAPGGSFSFVV